VGVFGVSLSFKYTRNGDQKMSVYSLINPIGLMILLGLCFLAENYFRTRLKWSSSVSGLTSIFLFGGVMAFLKLGSAFSA